MDRDELFRKNHDLFEMSMQQVLDDPGLRDRIPVRTIFVPRLNVEPVVA
jgi:hypothetical protein